MNVMDHITTSELQEQLEGRIRAAYFVEADLVQRRHGNRADSRRTYEHLDGKRNIHGRIESVWSKVLGNMLTHGAVDPNSYMRLLFANRNDRVPADHELYGESAWDAYVPYRRSRWRQKGSLARIDLQLFDMSLLDKQTIYPNKPLREQWRLTLQDPDANISVIFRYMVAASEGFASLAHQWEVAALMEYLTDPALYSEVWTSYLPRTLWEQAAALWNSFAGAATNECIGQGIGD